jgi:hypothetical protein
LSITAEENNTKTLSGFPVAGKIRAQDIWNVKQTFCHLQAIFEGDQSQDWCNNTSPYSKWGYVQHKNLSYYN